MVLDGATVAFTDDTLVERRGDFIWSGAFWGFSAGLLAGTATLPGYLS